MSYLFMGFLGRTVEVKVLDLTLIFGLIFVIGMVYSFYIRTDLEVLYTYIHNIKMNMRKKLHKVTHSKK